VVLALDAQGIDQFDAVSEVRRVSTFKTYSAHSGVAIKQLRCVFSLAGGSANTCVRVRAYKATETVYIDDESLYLIAQICDKAVRTVRPRYA
jgi:hypothetical protein